MKPGLVDLVENDGVGFPEDVESLPGDIADDPHGEPGARERLTPHDLFRQAELLTDRTDLVFEEIPQRLDQRKHHVVGKTADVVMALDLRCILGAGLDHVGVQGSLHQVLGIRNVDRHLFEHPDEHLTDDLAFPLGVGNAFERIDEPILGLHVNEVHVERAAERLFDLFCFSLAHQAVIDEYADELVPDCLVDQRRGH